MIRMTEGRRNWLRALAEAPRGRGLNPDGTKGQNGRGPIGYQCMTAGWTEWEWRKGSERLGTAELQTRYESWSDALADGWTNNHRERITPAGRAALEAYP